MFRKKRRQDGADDATVDETDGAEADEQDGAEDRAASTAPAARAERPDGPHDASEVGDPSQGGRVDLGGLWLPGRPGLEVRVEADQQTGEVVAVTLVLGDSALQVQPFAAPRSEGIWDEVRAEIASAMASDGVAAREVTGPYGVELTARVNTPEGPADVRFVGVDGPRWMVRALYQGAAAADPSREGSLGVVLSGLVVTRDSEARPVREALPLRLPKEMTEQAQAQAEADSEGTNGRRR